MRIPRILCRQGQEFPSTCRRLRCRRFRRKELFTAYQHRHWIHPKGQYFGGSMTISQRQGSTLLSGDDALRRGGVLKVATAILLLWLSLVLLRWVPRMP